MGATIRARGRGGDVRHMSPQGQLAPFYYVFLAIVFFWLFVYFLLVFIIFLLGFRFPSYFILIFSHTCTTNYVVLQCLQHVKIIKLLKGDVGQSAFVVARLPIALAHDTFGLASTNTHYFRKYTHKHQNVHTQNHANMENMRALVHEVKVYYYGNSTNNHRQYKHKMHKYIGSTHTNTRITRTTREAHTH